MCLWQNKGNPHPYFYWNLLSTPMFLKAKLTKVIVKVGTENKNFVGSQSYLCRNVFDVILSNVGFWPHLSPLTDRFLLILLSMPSIFASEIDGLSQKNVTKIAVKVWVEKLLRSYKFSNRNVFQMILSNFGSWTCLSPPHL